jgi:arylsulfatase A-like enzyme
MRLRAKLAVLTLGLILVGADAARAATAESSTAPANVVIILADDLGIGDVCSYGSCDPGRSTPNLDAIARQGARFTRAYSAAPICSPSRAALLTGRYPQRFGHEFNPDGIERGTRERLGTPLTETLLPQHLKPRGYATGIVGKWHLGPGPAQHPLARGFDEFFGFVHGAKLYYPTVNEPGMHWIAEDAKPGKEKTEQNPNNPLQRGRDPVQEPGYLTDAFTREAVSFIERHRAEPFFLYLPYNAPHTPLMVDDARYSKYAGVEGEARRVHAAMMGALDDGVGAIVEALRKNGVAEKTLVVFTSDHGCPTNIDACSNDGLRGGKRILLEGGVRVPMLALWPGTIAAGRVIDEPVSLIDLAATAVDLAGAAPPAERKLDGESLAPLLRGETQELHRDALFWRHGTNWAVLRGDWKLIGFEGLDHPVLFDLSSADGESRDVRAEKPEVAMELTRLYRDWESGMVEPLWDSGGKLWIALDGVMAGAPMKPLKGPQPGAVAIP